MRSPGRNGVTDCSASGGALAAGAKPISSASSAFSGATHQHGMCSRRSAAAPRRLAELARMCDIYLKCVRPAACEPNAARRRSERSPRRLPRRTRSYRRDTGIFAVAPHPLLLATRHAMAPVTMRLEL